jgi:hypothetical protein
MNSAAVLIVCLVFGTSASAVSAQGLPARQAVRAIGTNPTHTTLSASALSANYGAQITLTATVAPNSGTTKPTGSVTFYDGVSLLGSAPVAAFTATLKSSLLAPGSRQIVAHYNGDAFYAASSSSAATVTVGAQAGAGFAASTTPTGTAPVGVAAGDFNKDAFTDIAVANNGSNNLTVLLGQGDGTVTSSTNYPVGALPAFVAVADVNADGIADLIVANYGDSTISVLAGVGDGTFTAATSYSTGPGTGPLALAIADFNGDGYADIATADLDASQVSILLNDGAGAFTLAPSSPVVNGQASGVTVGDFNKDGKADLAVANYTLSAGFVSILFGNGDGTFQAPVSYDAELHTAGVVTTDFNADGFLDVAVVNTGSNTISVLKGKAGGAFNTAVNYPTGSLPFGITVVFSNGDQSPDLAVANALDGTVSVFVNNGDGTFAGAVNTGAGTNTQGVIATNLDGNGRQDLAVASANSNWVTFLLAATPTTTALAASPNPAALGSTITLSATVTPSTATGAVTFFDGSTNLGTANLVSGVATLSVTSLTLGTHSLTASYAGAAGFGSSTSPTVTETIRNGSTTALSVNPPASQLGQAVTLTATVAPSSVTGSVSFYDGASVLGTVPVVAGGATITTSLLTVGTHSITARYTGDSSVVGSASSSSIETVTAQGGGGFLPPVNYALGSGPYGVAIGDFNGDGRADIAAANFSSNNVSILIGNSDGTFGAATNYSVGTGPQAIAVGDLNGDGKQDLVVVNNTAGTITLLIGNGNGAFVTAGTTITVGSLPNAAVITDLNRDGFADVVVTTPGSNQIQILAGNGDGTFQPATTKVVGGGARAIVAADFNKDGITDLALACGNGANILIGNGDGTLKTVVNYPAHVGPVAVAVGDFRGTGQIDIAIANSISNDVSVLLNKGDGTFASAVNYPVGQFPQSVVVTDFNGDGKLDIATANQAVNTVSVLLNTGNGQFGAATSYAAGNSPIALVTGAFNGQGQANLAVANFGGSNLSILLALQASQVALIANPNPNPTGVPVTLTATVTPAGVTGTVTFYDGSNVLGTAAVNNSGIASVTKQLSTGDRSLTAAYSGDAVFGPSLSPVVHDLVSLGPVGVGIYATPSPAVFGKPILLIANLSSTTATGTVTFYNSGNPIGTSIVSNGAATLTTTLLPAGTDRLQARYNGDISFGASFSGSFNLIVTPTPSFSLAQPVLAPVGGSLTSVAVGDFNADSKPDVVATNGGVSILLGLGNGNLQPAVNFASGTNPVQAVVADFNRDGKMDIATVNSGSNDVSILLGNGDGTFQNAVNYPVGSVPDSIAFSDFNGDGSVDLVVANHDSANVSVLFGNGNGSFQPAQSIAVGGQNVYVIAADLNGDGAPDFAVADAASGNVYFVQNDLSATFFHAPVAYAAGASLTNIALGDLNGDGQLDVVAANGSANVINVLLNDGNGGFASPVPYAVPAAAQFVNINDINGDQHSDVVVSMANGKIAVLISTSTGVLSAPASFPAGSNPGAIASAGFTGNGHIQFAVADMGTNQVEMVLDGSPTLSIVAGNQQSAATGTAYGTALQVSASGFGLPAGGVAISFAAPSFGPGGFFQGGGYSSSVTTNSFGVAATPAFVANGATGPFTIAALAGTAVVNFNLTNTLNTCTFSVSSSPIGFDLNGGSADITVNASAPSCGWAAAADSPWITLRTISGAGSSAVGISVLPNNTGQSRTGNLLIAGTLVHVSEGATPQVFGDVLPSAYYFDAVNLLYSHGITTGCAQGANLLYCPDDPATRDQMAVFLVRAIYGGDNFNYSPTPYFADVQPSHFAFPWVQKLYELGITTGCATNLFCPGDPVTRAQMAVLIIRMRLGATAAFNYPTTPYFTDVPANYWAFAYIQRMKLEGITTGCSTTTYCPETPVTRGQVAVFLDRAAFNELLPVGTAVLTQTFPAVVNRGATAVLTLTGANTHFLQGVTALAPVTGVTINSVTVLSDTSLSVSITVSASAPTQPQSLVAITGMEEAVLPNGLEIQ